MSSHFAPAAVKFLQGLKRHNDRDWFNERKPVYERQLKAPMLALIDEVNAGLVEFAPEHIRPAHKAMIRIYRDTRFSPDKRPYKHQIAAWWPRSGMEKISGGGFYFHLSGTEVTVAAGVYLPEREQLLQIRRYLEQHHEKMRALLGDPALQAAMQPMDGLRLTRAPKGFPPDSPALDLLLQRQWGVTCTLPFEVALRPDFSAEVLRRFQLASPLVHFLNQAIKPATRSGIF